MDYTVEYNFKDLTRELANYNFNINERELSANLRVLTLYETVKKTKKNLKVFKKVKDEDLIKLCEVNFKNFCNNLIKVKDLKKVRKKVRSSLLKNKLNDVILLIKNYNTILRKNRLENPCALLKGYRILKKINIFKGSVLVFNSLDTLNFLQLSIFKEALKQSKRLKIVINENVEKDAKNNSCLKEILTFAKDIKAKISCVFLKNYGTETKYENLSFFEKNIEFNRFEDEKIEGKNNQKNDILFFKSRGSFEEVENICRFIKKQVLDGKYNLDDFSIFVKNTDDYLYLLRENLKKYNIGYSLKEKISLKNSLLPKFILLLLEVMLENFNTGKVFQFLDLGLLNISSDEINKLKIYNETYGISMKDWFYGFCKYKPIDEKDKNLKILNEIRKKIVGPILELKENLKKYFFCEVYLKNKTDTDSVYENIPTKQCETIEFELEKDNANNGLNLNQPKENVNCKSSQFDPPGQTNKIFKINVKDIIFEINNFLEKNNVKKNLENLIYKLSCEGFSEESSNILDSWFSVRNIFIEIADFFKEKKISGYEFYCLLKTLIYEFESFKGEKFLNTVNIFTDLKNIEQENTKILFLFGATDEAFGSLGDDPFSFFTNNELKELKRLGTNIFCDISKKIEKEKLNFKKILKTPKKLVIATYPEVNLNGEKNKLSEYFKDIKNNIIINDLKILVKFPENEVLCHSDIISIFSDLILKEKNSPEFLFNFLNTEKEYVENKPDDFFKNIKNKDATNHLKHLAKFNKNKDFFLGNISTLFTDYLSEDEKSFEFFSNFFKCNKEYVEKINILKKATEGKKFTLKSFKLENKLVLSPTQIETYYSCALKFFLKYILKLKEIKKENFDNLKYGSLVHYVLEKALKKYAPEEILNFSDESLMDVILKLLNNYAKNNFSYLLENNKKIENLLKRSSNILFSTLKHIANGFINSEFLPKFFELKIGETLPSLKINSENNSLEIVGKIDRIDVFKNLENDGETNYLRIVDYKTGKKEFNFSDFFYGLNLQLLIYMLIILKNEEPLNLKNPKFAGVLYMPVRNTTVLSKNKYLGNGKINSSRLKSLRMTGLILDDIFIANAMENGVEGKYIPLTLKDNKLKKDEKTLVNTDQVDLIFKYTEYLIKKMIEKIFCGDFSPAPLKSKNYCSCDFCPYKNICKIQYKETLLTELNEKGVEEIYSDISDKLKNEKI